MRFNNYSYGVNFIIVQSCQRFNFEIIKIFSKKHKETVDFRRIWVYTYIIKYERGFDYEQKVDKG